MSMGTRAAGGRGLRRARSRRSRWAAAAAGCLAAAAIAAGGCGWSGPRADHPFERTLELDADGSSSIAVRTRNGRVSVARAPGRETMLIALTGRATTAERAAAAAIDVRADGAGVLSITCGWPGGWESSEQARFEVLAPELSSATVETSNGSVRVDGVAGPVDVRTSNGRVTVLDQRGPTRVRTSNGRIRADLVGPDARPFDLESSNGAIEVRLPDGFAGWLDAETSNGSISFAEASRALTTSSLSISDGRLRVRIGEPAGDDPLAEASSRVRSSNGRVRILPPSEED